MTGLERLEENLARNKRYFWLGEQREQLDKRGISDVANGSRERPEGAWMFCRALKVPCNLLGGPVCPISPEQHLVVPRPCPLQTWCLNSNIWTSEDSRQSQVN